MGPDEFLRKLKDLRFRGVEDQIFKAYFIENKRGLNELAEYVGVPHSTVCRHHQTVSEIKNDYIEFLVFKFRKEFEEARCKAELGQAISFFLMFIVKNKKFLRGFFQEGAGEMIFRILRWLRDEKGMDYRVLEEGLLIKGFGYGMYAILEDWSEREFRETEMRAVFRRIVGLVAIIEKMKGV